jgi:hypothetical protein
MAAQSFLPATASPLAAPAPNQVGGVGGAPDQTDLKVDSQSPKRTQNALELQPAQVFRADSASVPGTIDVAAGAASAQMPSGGGGRGGRAGRARAALTAASVAPEPPLPAAASGKTMLRADAAGALFRSTNAGKSWKSVKGKWQGKVVRLMTPQDAPSAGNAVFQLNTDTGEIWFSRDGNRWSLSTAH